MWFWHAPALCNAAVTSRPVHALQIVSLLALGSIFWRQILAPREQERLSPPGAVLYLFSACVTCSVLGIIITFSPVTVCSIYTMQPATLRDAADHSRGLGHFSPERDQQIGGLLMWVPMCLIYLSAIFAQIARWFALSAGTGTQQRNRKWTNDEHTEHTARLGAAPARTLPRPTYFPAGLAMGTTFIFWGLITSWVIFLAGIGLFSAVAGRMDHRNSP